MVFEPSFFKILRGIALHIEQGRLDQAQRAHALVLPIGGTKGRGNHRLRLGRYRRGGQAEPEQQGQEHSQGACIHHSSILGYVVLELGNRSAPYCSITVGIDKFV